jgi:ABC-2 type transport system ATP-binding protein
MTTPPAALGERLALRVRGLRVSYGSLVAVDAIDLDVRVGEIYGLLGPNGAGKTSALSAIEGLLRPDAGAITIGGVDARAHPLRAKARLGVQLQSTSFHSDLTLAEIVRLFAGLYGVTLSKEQIRERLADSGLDAEASKRFREISGGQQQRFSLLIATIHDPPVVLLDEPTAGLDPQARRRLWDRIERFRKEGRSIVLTTHSMEEAQAVCDRVAIMDRGRIITVDTPADLIATHRDDPRVREVAHGEVTLEDVFIGLTGRDLRD